MRHRRSAYTIFQLLVLLAVLLILLGMLLPAVQKVREAAARMQSSNNLKQLAIAIHNYNGTNNRMPPGEDGNHFSGLVYLLSYIEQDNLFKGIDLTKSPDHANNSTSRSALIKNFMSPLDGAAPPDDKSGPTSYFLVAGSKHSLEDNDGAFYRDSANRLANFTDGTSNTMMTLESLRGDGGTKAVTVKRQHVRLTKGYLKGLTDASGVKDFEDGKQIAGDRGVTWMDGRFLRSTINLTRGFNDAKPDVDCGGDGGLAGPRSFIGGTNVGMVDGAVRFVSSSAKLDTWKAVATRAGNEVIADW
jgi:type II secretory pathway pseudopilin PulG